MICQNVKNGFQKLPQEHFSEQVMFIDEAAAHKNGAGN